MANYQVTTAAGKTYSFATELTPQEAFKMVSAMPRTSFLDWVMAGGSEPSEKQTLWALKVAQDSLNAKAPDSVGPFLGLISQINRMQEGAKRPVTLRFSGFTLKAVTAGFNKGGVYIFTSSGYSGKISKDGILSANSNIENALLEVSQDPEGAARAYGRATGNCSCCGRDLSDPVSVFGGIGPVCLERLSGKGARAELEADFKEFQAENLLDSILATV